MATAPAQFWPWEPVYGILHQVRMLSPFLTYTKSRKCYRKVRSCTEMWAALRGWKGSFCERFVMYVRWRVWVVYLQRLLSTQAIEYSDRRPGASGRMSSPTRALWRLCRVRWGHWQVPRCRRRTSLQRQPCWMPPMSAGVTGELLQGGFCRCIQIDVRCLSERRFVTLQPRNWAGLQVH